MIGLIWHLPFDLILLNYAYSWKISPSYQWQNFRLDYKGQRTNLFGAIKQFFDHQFWSKTHFTWDLSNCSDRCWTSEIVWLWKGQTCKSLGMFSHYVIISLLINSNMIPVFKIVCQFFTAIIPFIFWKTGSPHEKVNG